MANPGGDQHIQPTAESPEIIAFASRMYDAARKGDTAVFEQALPAGLPPNMTNDKGDTLVCLPILLPFYSGKKRPLLTRRLTQRIPTRFEPSNPLADFPVLTDHARNISRPSTSDSPSTLSRCRPQ